MKSINCLIVEDEPLATEILSDYVAQVPFLHLAGTCSDVLYAMEFLQKADIDLIFLDIRLPKVKGLDFLRTLKNPPQVIVTTAYHEYALQGYELNVIDYLLKPIEFNRFLTAVNKVAAATDPTDSFFVYVDKKKVKVRKADILYVEGLREYIRIHLTAKSLTSKMTMSAIEKILGNQKFVRAHRSFIVSIDKVESFSSTEIEVGGESIPIGRSYGEIVQRILSA